MHITPGDVHALLETYGYAAVFLFVVVESLGVPFPGELMLVTAAAYAGTGRLQIPLVIAAAALGGFLGFDGSYALGRTGGRALLERYGARIHLGPERLLPAQRFFDRHGDKTVFLGRFVAVLRAWAAFLAGLNEMPVGKFLVFNLAGAVIWSTLYGVLAFEFGQTLLERFSKYLGYGTILLVVAAVVLFFLRRRAQRFERRAAGAAEDVRGDVRPD